jgi:GAF domain-containing protein
MSDMDIHPGEHLELLYQASLEFNSTLDVDELLPTVFDRILEALAAEAGSIWLRKGDSVVCEIARGPVGEQIEGLELPLGAGIVGSTAVTGEAELVADVRQDPRFVHQVDEATGFVTRSVLSAPLKAGDQVLGVLQAINKRSGDGQFGESDKALLLGLASTAGLALRNAQLHDAERRARDLKTLLGISREIASTFDVERLAVTVVNMAGQAINYDRAAIALDEGGRIVLTAVSGKETLEESDENRELERLIAWLTERNEFVYAQDLSNDDGVAGEVKRAFPDYIDKARIRSIALVPLKDEEGRMGAFYMESANPGFLGEAGREAAELLANQISVAIRNAHLYGQVPFIGLLEPVAAWRKRLAGMPRTRLLRRYGIPIAALIAFLLIPWGQRISPHETQILPGGRVPVRATVDGQVTEIRVAEGETVTEDDVLAVLRDDDIRMSIQETTAALAIAERNAAAAQARGDEAAAQIAQIEAGQLGKQLALLNDQLERTRLRVPPGVSGVVLTLRPQEKLGERLRAGETFVVLGRTDRLEVEAHVEQNDISRVAAGQPVRLKVAARPDYLFVATVSRIASYADSSYRGEPTFVVTAGLDNSQGLLKPGMEARAKIVGARRPIAYLIGRPFVRWFQMRFWR